MRIESEPRHVIWLAALFALLPALAASATAGGATQQHITFIGERGDLYIFRIDSVRHYVSGPGHEDSSVYVVRTKSDNTEVERHVISRVQFNADPVTNELTRTVVDDGSSNPIDQSEWTPVERYTAGLIRMRTWDGSLVSESRESIDDSWPGTVRMLGPAPGGMYTFDHEFFGELFSDGSYMYVVQRGEGGGDISSEDLIYATSLAQITGRESPAAFLASDIGPDLAAAIFDWGLSADEVALPVHFIYPVGWSPAGNFAYLEYRHRYWIHRDSREPYATWSIYRVVQNMVTDEQIYAGPIGDPEEKIERTDGGWQNAWDVLAAAQERDAGYAGVLSSFGIDDRGEISLSPARNDSELGFSLETTMDDSGNLVAYTLRAVRAGEGTKVISSGTLPRQSEWTVMNGAVTVRHMRVVGSITSPFEPRVAVVIALELESADSTHRWVEFMLVGCHTGVGFR